MGGLGQNHVSTIEVELKVNKSNEFGLVRPTISIRNYLLSYNSLSVAIHLCMIWSLLNQMHTIYLYEFQICIP